MFSLGHREKENDARGEMISGGESAAGTYKTLAMEKFFKGMQQRCMNSEIFDGTYQMTPENLEKAIKWLDMDLEKCLNNKFVELVTAVGGIQSAQKQPTREKIFDDFSDAVVDDWLGKIFPAKDNDQKMQYAGIIIPVAYLQIAQNSASKYRKVLDKAINLVIDNA